MRLNVFVAAAVAASAIAGSASASASWGSSDGKKKVGICQYVATKKVVRKGKPFAPGTVFWVKSKEAEKLVASKKAVLLSTTSWKGGSCLIDTAGKAHDENGDKPAPAPAPAPAPTAADQGGSGSGEQSSDDDKDDDEDEDEAPPPPG